MSGWMRITVRDLETGEEEAIEIKDDYALITAGDCYLDKMQVTHTGTHQLVIRNSKGQKREVTPDSEASS